MLWTVILLSVYLGGFPTQKWEIATILDVAELTIIWEVFGHLKKSGISIARFHEN